MLRLARELEIEFPDQVHAEFKIATWTRTDFDPEQDPVQSIDLAVCDFRDFPEDDASQKRFRSWTHEVFVEAKWLGKGWWREPGRGTLMLAFRALPRTSSDLPVTSSSPAVA